MREVEELELRGNFDAPRTGGVVRLESRFKGPFLFLSLFTIFSSYFLFLLSSLLLSSY